MKPNAYQREQGRRLLLAALRANDDAILIGSMQKRDGWIRWRATNNDSAARRSQQGMTVDQRVKFLRQLALTLGVRSFVQFVDEVCREAHHSTLSAFLDQHVAGWRGGAL